MKFGRKSSLRSQPINRDGHVIGLDIGATSVRAAVLALRTDAGRPSVTVHGLGSVPLPPGAVVNGAVMEPTVVTQALRQLWEVNKFGCRKVVLGVANPQAVVRQLQIPNLSPQQRDKALPFQAREIIALPMDEVVLDYVQVGAADPQSGLVSGLLIATPRRPVLAAVEAVEKAGLTVGRVDLSSFGALRSIGDEHLVVQAVIDLGAHLTTIVIHQNGVPKLVRTLARGGQELTDQLVENLSLDAADAERVKRDIGLNGQRDAASEALQAGIRPLLAEIRSSINYFRAGSEGVQIQGIALTGGAAALPGLDTAISTQNGVPVFRVRPTQHISGQPAGTDKGAAELARMSVLAEFNPAATAVSVGLAMGAAA